MKKILFIFVLLVIGMSSSLAQNTLNGTVVDKDGNPIPGVKVKAKGQDGFVISNLDGTFHIDSRKPVKKIQLTYPGFKEDKYKTHSNMVATMKKSNWWNEKPGRQFFIGPQMGFFYNHKDYDKGYANSGKYFPSVGLMVGWGGIAKIYTKFYTNTYYSSFADFYFLPLGVESNDEYWGRLENNSIYEYDEITSHTDLSVGGMIRLKCPIYLYAGVVCEWYGSFYDVKGNIFWDSRYTKNYFSCLGEVGIMMTFKRFFINAGAVIGEGVQLNGGIGIML